MRSNEEQLRTEKKKLILKVRTNKASPNQNHPMRSNEEQIRTTKRKLILTVRINKA